MEFIGRIMKVLPVQSGTSQSGKEWSRQDFIFEYFEHDTDRYSDKVLLSVMNEGIERYDLREGDEVVIGFGCHVREYQGRYYNEPRLYKLEKVRQLRDAAPQSTQAEPTVNQPTESEKSAQGAKNEDDLPF